MSTVTHDHQEPSSGSMERDARQLHADRHKIAPGEIAIGVIIGRASEYFDFFVFGIACVLVFPALFFPFEARLEGTLYSFAIFAMAFVARPFGTSLFMAIQRRWGRSVKLTGALFLLGTATAGMAFLPSYATIGPAAIILLVLFRIAQGVAFGGSWDGLPSLLALNAPRDRRGWFSMLGQLGAPIGFLLASTLFFFLNATLTVEDFLSWGWRYPFFVAFAINVVALFARLRLVVTQEYTELMEEGELEPIGTVEMIRAQGSNIVIGAFVALASYALFHLVTIFPLSWVSLDETQSVNDVLLVQMVGGVVCILATIASGVIADRIGRRTMLGAMAVLIAVFAVVGPFLMQGEAVSQRVFMLVGFVLLGLSYGQASGTVTANFQSRYRYTGAALSSDLAWLIGAAFAPLVALGLSANFGIAYLGIYLMSGAICTLVALRVNRTLGARRLARGQVR